MKQTIRFNVFETNSSSCHSLVLNNQEDIKDFIDDIKQDIRCMGDTDDLKNVIDKVKDLETELTDAYNNNKFSIYEDGEC